MFGYGYQSEPMPWWGWVLSIAPIAVIVGGFAYFIYSIERDLLERRASPPVASVFRDGQIVRMKAFGATGMVVGMYCPRVIDGGNCTYSVRFSAMQATTNTRLFGSDGPIDFAPVALVNNIREYELEAVRP